ncbi:DddA-like double-stranded DNA deaminase toxin [Allokutzneria sp. NRRL B-24872]|uniref:DddA-like double-stranded DNA deaminase toxin n=1 Tax=Allokutzneria sp. NRRL B-24872 TaxID=1137961 RepID=UPI000A39C556|nr:DddA-like double-stranded DNA deaminase toxin [Allokutzneria sp. NRRL B-24872]
MSIRSEVVAAARAAVAMLPVGLVDVVEDAIDAAAIHWQHATQGGRDSAIEEVHATFEAAKDDLHALRQLMLQVPVRVEAWIVGLGGRALSDVASTDARTADSVTPAERARILESARAVLTPGVPGARALGKWVASDGSVHDLSSGPGPWFGPTQDWARERGHAPPAGIWMMARHIELQFAVRMRAMVKRRPAGAGPLHETIAIDRSPCEPVVPGGQSCDTLLPLFLPPGSSLTVLVEDGSRYTYQGVEQR